MKLSRRYILLAMSQGVLALAAACSARLDLDDGSTDDGKGDGGPPGPGDGGDGGSLDVADPDGGYDVGHDSESDSGYDSGGDSGDAGDGIDHCYDNGEYTDSMFGHGHWYAGDCYCGGA